jgi:hypothetical protein
LDNDLLHGYSEDYTNNSLISSSEIDLKGYGVDYSDEYLSNALDFTKTTVIYIIMKILINIEII